MRTLRWRTGKVPRHRAAAGARWIGALVAHPWYAALAVGVVALVSGVMLLPGHSAPPAARGCGLVACTSRRVTSAAATGESGASLRGVGNAPARARVAPAQPGGRVHATPSPSPSQFAPHHGQAKGLTHRHHGR